MPLGSSSSFPGSTDQFALKVAGMTEAASHINHYTDSIINIEKYLIDKLGGGVVSSNASGLIYGSNLILGTATFTVTATSFTQTLTVSGTVPSMFGTNPFNDLGFIAVPSVYVTIPGATPGGVWADQSWSGPQPLNLMMGWVQQYPMLAPLGGSNFAVYIAPQLYSSAASWSGSGMFSDTFRRGNSAALGPNWNEYERNSSSTFTITSSTFKFVDSANQYALAYPKLFDDSAVLGSFKNQEVIVEVVNAVGDVTRSLDQFNLGGLVVRGTKNVWDGKYYLYGGYVLSFGHHTVGFNPSIYGSMKLLKLASGGDGRDIDSYTVLASTTSFNSTTQLGSTVLYSLSVIDNGSGNAVLAVKQKIGSAGWTSVLSYTDSSTPIPSGWAGFYHGYYSGYYHARTVFNYRDLVIQQPVASGSPLSLIQADVRMLYVKINDSLKTLGNNW